MGATPLSLLAERARTDSLFKRLEKAGLLGDFFSWFYSEQPPPDDCLAWLKQRNCKSSVGAVSNMVLKHGLAYRLGEAQDASDAVVAALPEDAEARTKTAIQARVLELSLSALGSKELLALLRINQQNESDRDRLQLDREKAQLKREELALSREKFEFDAVKKAIEHAKEIKTIAGNRSLSSETQINLIRRRLFPQLAEEVQP